ncbi:class I SAM-dependent methyltransferase [Actinopolymorpha singaporensis]|uniref:Methyltransferase domain-containing protein n=1 Tax=Actinopolymorpha singaporensis TaxID=117157 RepID=A0A1H1MMK7_9ACTN|nr:class I SAM-dependent methyltransferase [Actinopolymorpha singaporensis]SDR87862.1 Methyltransferase domain-containing protein [Actinopolymorpha singaporensis]
MSVQTVQTTAQPTLAEQAPVLLSKIAGYVAHRTVVIGLRAGLLRTVAGSPGISADELSDRLGLDPFYVSVWCRSAFASGILARRGDGGDGFELEPHLGTLLLDTSSPAYVGDVFLVCDAPEMFGRFEENLATGRRMWWDDTTPDWINGVAGAGTPFYTRLIPAGLAHVPGLAERLSTGCRVVDTACGSGVGLVRLASTYPNCTVVGVDGDRHSVEVARERVRAAGLEDRVRLVCSPLEDMVLDEPAGLVINNISMHECRDADVVTRNVAATLEPGGWFVISDFPFPDSDAGLRTPPGQVMCGIQFFEAQIDDQLVPRSTYDELLARHGFANLGSVQLTPMHALTYGQVPPAGSGG